MEVLANKLYFLANVIAARIGAFRSFCWPFRPPAPPQEGGQGAKGVRDLSRCDPVTSDPVTRGVVV